MFKRKLFTDDWMWVNSHIDKAKANWLQHAQDILADSNRLVSIVKLTPQSSAKNTLHPSDAKQRTPQNQIFFLHHII
jgi:hypothetical protein